MAVWGKAAAWKYGIPFVSSTTTFAFNRHAAAYMKQSPAALIGMLFSMPRIRSDIARLRARGYPVNHVLDLIQNDENTHTVVYTSPQFQPCAETFSDKYAFVGPILRPSESVFEKTRDTLVYISLGTVNNNRLPFYRACIDALGETDYQAVIAVGDKIDITALGDIPANIRIAPHVDQMAVLAQADVFLTHCGMNSASEALAFGVPLLMLPQTPEQGAVARRTAERGAGLLLKKEDAASIRHGIRTLLDDTSYRDCACQIAEEFAACSGAVGAADKILSVIEAY